MRRKVVSGADTILGYEIFSFTETRPILPEKYPAYEQLPRVPKTCLGLRKMHRVPKNHLCIVNPPRTPNNAEGASKHPGIRNRLRYQQTGPPNCPEYRKVADRSEII